MLVVGHCNLDIKCWVFVSQYLSRKLYIFGNLQAMQAIPRRLRKGIFALFLPLTASNLQQPPVSQSGNTARGYQGVTDGSLVLREAWLVRVVSSSTQTTADLNYCTVFSEAQYRSLLCNVICTLLKRCPSYWA